MPPPLALINAGQLGTLAGPKRPRTGQEMQSLAIIHDGAFLIQDGHFTQIGRTEEIKPRITRNHEVVDCQGKVVLPGFVDAHTHLVFAGNRLDDYERRIKGQTYKQIAAEGGGIASTVRATRAASESDLLEQAQRHASWMLANGTTTAECKSGYGLSLESEVTILRTIRELSEKGPLKCVPTFLGAHAVPPEFKNAQSYTSHLLEVILPKVASEHLAEYCDAFCEDGYFSVDQCRRIFMRAKEFGLGLRAHADQFASNGAVKMACELNARTVDHLEHIDATGLEALIASKVQPVCLPGSVYALGLRRYPPMREMIDRDLAPVLATDFNPGSSPTPSIPMVLSLACTQMGILPSEAITAATINAAYSLDRGDRVGSIEPGKDADFVIWDCQDYREIPYYFGHNAAGDVFVSGLRTRPTLEGGVGGG